METPGALVRKAPNRVGLSSNIGFMPSIHGNSNRHLLFHEIFFSSAALGQSELCPLLRCSLPATAKEVSGKAGNLANSCGIK